MKKRIDHEIMFVGDDPAYSFLLEKWVAKKPELIICSNCEKMRIPADTRRINPDRAFGYALGLSGGEV